MLLVLELLSIIFAAQGQASPTRAGRRRAIIDDDDEDD